MTYVTGKSYAFLGVFCMGLLSVMLVMVLFMGIVFSFPNASTNNIAILITVPLSAVIGLLLPVWVWKRNGSPKISFYNGLASIAECLMSGCFPLTAIYLFPVMIVVYLIALVNTCIGLFKGKTFTEDKWFGVVNWFYKRKHGYGMAA